MIKGIIFDLDGVLVSTDELHYQAWKRLAQELGIKNFTKEDNERQRGVSRMESLEIVLNKGEKVYSLREKEELAKRKNDYYKDLLETLDNKAVLKGVVKTICYLKQLDMKIGIGSVSKNTPAILQRTELEQYIDKVSCGLDITNSKPDPEVFLVAAGKLGLEPKNCLVVEDSKAGIVAAKAAGMKSLGVGPYYRNLGATYEATGLDADIPWATILRDEDE